MSVQDSAGVYDQAEFADNPEARCSIVLILDVSGSMGGPNIQTVNQALVKFRDVIQEDSVTALRADVAVIEFDHEARVVLDFTNGTDFEPPELSVKGGTNYSKAVNLALDTIEARKQSYRDGGIAYYRSLAYFLTDGRTRNTTTTRIFSRPPRAWPRWSRTAASRSSVSASPRGHVCRYVAAR